MLKRAALALAAGGLAMACARVPVTGRAQLDLVPDRTMSQLGAQAFAQQVEERRVVTGPDAQLLEEVGARLVRAAPRARPNGWTFALFEDETANAWALPGGYVGFHTGMLPMLRHEAGMAFVTGHEVGHVVARHGSERLSQQLAVFGGLTVFNAWLAGRTDISDDQRNLALAAVGLGAQVGVLLPFSRTHESEADIIGMMSMAGAGYPPEEAIAVWERMAEAQTRRPPAWLSTHPTHEARAEILREWLPQAQRRYQRNRLPHDTTQVRWTTDTPRRGPMAR